MDVNNNNRKDDIKKGDIELNNIDHGYSSNEYKDLIDTNFKFRLRDGDLRLTKFDNLKLV